MTTLLAQSSFSSLDWIVLGLYFALLVGSGVWLSRKQKGTEDYFLAGRKMPAWAVAISVLASTLSAATFLGAPQQAFGGNLAYISATLGGIVATAVVALVFIPAYYRANVTTVYELLEHRFGPAAKVAGSWAFMVGRVFASGARIYIAAHALAFAMFGGFDVGPLLIAVALLSVAGILYTIAGGIETVIWTDVVQTAVFLVAVAAAIVALLVAIPADVGQIASTLANPGPGEASKLVFIDFTTDLTKPFTLWTALIGIMLLNLAALGTDHDLVQRMLTCRNAWQGSKSVVMSTIIGIPVVLMFMIVGLLLWVFYTRPELMGAAAPVGERALVGDDASKRVFLHFITNELPPGMSGLMIAGLFAVGLGSLDSALNAMSATFVNDTYRPRLPGRSEAHYLKVGRIGVVVSGILLGVFAAVCVFWQRQGGQSFIDLALSVMTYAYSGLLGVFLCGLFTRRGSAASAVAAMVTGFLVTLALEPTLLAWLDNPPSDPGQTTDVALDPTLLHPRNEHNDRLPDWVEWAETLAWPWRMTIATLVSFLVAVAWKGRR